MLPKSIYFFMFGANGSLLPFLILYYQTLGFSGLQMDILTGLFPLVMAFTALGWAGLANATQRHKAIFIALMLGCWVSIFFLSVVSGYLAVLCTITAFAACFGALSPFIDSAVLAWLGERSYHFGKTRLWGSVGFGLASPLTGLLAKHYGLHACFYVYLALLAVATILTCLFPKQTVTLARPSSSGLDVLKQGSWLWFFVMVFLAGVGLYIGGGYASLHMKNLSISETIIGLSLTFAALGDVPFMFFGHRLFTVQNTRRWLFAALVVTSFYLWLYTLSYLPVHFLFVRVLDGCIFSILFMAGRLYIHEVAPKHLELTLQSLFTTVLVGLSGMTGGFLGGALYDQFGIVVTFRWCALIIIGFTIGLYVFQKRSFDGLSES
jgi:MFS transporter, PPP family, 3-phenylpropionic acid transporter